MSQARQCHHLRRRVNWRDRFEVLLNGGHQHVELTDREIEAIQDECSQAEAHRQQLVQEAKNHETEMQIALAAVGGGQRALVSEHELRVCGLQTEIFEANGREKRLRGELSDVSETSMRLAQLEGRLVDTELSLRASEEGRLTSAQELRASEEHRLRQVEDMRRKLPAAKQQRAPYWPTDRPNARPTALMGIPPLSCVPGPRPRATPHERVEDLNARAQGADDGAGAEGLAQQRADDLVLLLHGALRLTLLARARRLGAPWGVALFPRGRWQTGSIKFPTDPPVNPPGRRL